MKVCMNVCKNFYLESDSNLPDVSLDD